MNKQLDRQQTQFLEVNNQLNYLNFEQWASEVRRQMIESLQRKGVQRESKNQEKKIEKRLNSKQT